MSHSRRLKTVILALTAIIDCAIGAWLGHDGFQWPGSGDYFHMLHHKHFDCIYGALHIPIDWLFGTYAGSKEDVKKIWGRTPSEKKPTTQKFTQLLFLNTLYHNL